MKRGIKSIISLILMLCLIGTNVPNMNIIVHAEETEIKPYIDNYEVEENDTYNTANQIQVNKEYIGNLETSNAVDLYKIILEQAGSFNINIRNIQSTQAYVWKVTLYTEDIYSNRTQINSWYTTANRNSIFTRYRLPKGVYYIRVEKGYNYSDLEYQIGTTYEAETLETCEIENNNTLDNANMISLNKPYIGNIPTVDDFDYFKFTLDMNSKIQIHLTQDINPKKSLYQVTLYRKQMDGYVIYDRFRSYDNTVTFGHSIHVPKGEYYVLVEQGDKDVGIDSNIDYSLKITQEITSEEVDDRDMPYDVIGIPIAVNKNILLNAKDEGQYTFFLPQQGKVTMSLFSYEVDDDDVGIELYRINEDGNEVLLQKGKLETTPIRLVAGSYYIKINQYPYEEPYDQYINLIVNYGKEDSSNFETESNNTYQTANLIQLNKEYTANIESVQDVDYYKVVLEQPGSFYISLKNENTYNGWAVSLYSEDIYKNHNLIGTWSSRGFKNSIFTKYRLPKGAYYIKVENYNEGDYQIATSYMAETNDIYEIENNNSIEEANPINTNKFYIGNISSQLDLDCFEFAVNADSEVQIKISNSTLVEKSLYKVSLYHKLSDGNKVLYDRFMTTEQTLTLGNSVNIPKGDYIVVVENGINSAKSFIDYTLFVSQQQTTKKVNVNDMPYSASGKPLAVNTKVLLVEQDKSEYAFRISQQGKLKFSIKGNFVHNCCLRLYKIDVDGDKQLILDSYDYDDWNNDYYKKYNETEEISLKAGCYSIYINGEEDSQYDNIELCTTYTPTEDISKVSVSAIAPQTFTGNAIKPSISLTYNSKNLVQNKDYTVQYSNNTNAGTATITITGINGFEGTKKVMFSILKAKQIMSGTNVYSKKYGDKSFKLTAKTNGNGKLSYTSSNPNIASVDKYGNIKIVSVGTAYITVKAQETSNYSASEIKITIKVDKGSQIVTTSKSTYTVVYGNKKTKINAKTSKDGKLKYSSSNSKVAIVDSKGLIITKGYGKAIITITASQTTKYKQATKKITIVVNPKPSVIVDVYQSKKSTIKVLWKKDSLASGYEIWCATNSDFNKGLKKMLVKSNKTTSYNITKLKKGVTYYVMLRTYKTVDNKKIYGDYSYYYYYIKIK